jgi:hypothetical protein
MVNVSAVLAAGLPFCDVLDGTETAARRICELSPNCSLCGTSFTTP